MRVSTQATLSHLRQHHGCPGWPVRRTGTDQPEFWSRLAEARLIRICCPARPGDSCADELRCLGYEGKTNRVVRNPATRTELVYMHAS